MASKIPEQRERERENGEKDKERRNMQRRENVRRMAGTWVIRFHGTGWEWNPFHRIPKRVVKKDRRLDVEKERERERWRSVEGTACQEWRCKRHISRGKGYFDLDGWADLSQRCIHTGLRTYRRAACVGDREDATRRDAARVVVLSSRLSSANFVETRSYPREKRFRRATLQMNSRIDRVSGIVNPGILRGNTLNACVCSWEWMELSLSLSLSLFLSSVFVFPLSPSFSAFCTWKRIGSERRSKGRANIWYIVRRTSGRKSRFNRRGFEIMKFTAWRLDSALTSANRVRVAVSGTTNGVTVSTGDDDRVPSLFSCNFYDSLLPLAFSRLPQSARIDTMFERTKCVCNEKIVDFCASLENFKTQKRVRYAHGVWKYNVEHPLH